MVPAPPPPPAPKPNPSSTAPSTNPNRGALLNSIHKGTRLKKTTTNDRSAPLVVTSSSSAEKKSQRDDSNNFKKPSGLGGLFAGGMPNLRPVDRTANLPSMSKKASNSDAKTISSSKGSLNTLVNPNSSKPTIKEQFGAAKTVAAIGMHQKVSPRDAISAASVISRSQNPPQPKAAEQVSKGSVFSFTTLKKTNGSAGKDIVKPEENVVRKYELKKSLNGSEALNPSKWTVSPAKQSNMVSKSDTNSPIKVISKKAPPPPPSRPKIYGSSGLSGSPSAAIILPSIEARGQAIKMNIPKWNFPSESQMPPPRKHSGRTEFKYPSDLVQDTHKSDEEVNIEALRTDLAKKTSEMEAELYRAMAKHDFEHCINLKEKLATLEKLLGESQMRSIESDQLLDLQRRISAL